MTEQHTPSRHTRRAEQTTPMNTATIAVYSILGLLIISASFYTGYLTGKNNVLESKLQQAAVAPAKNAPAPSAPTPNVPSQAKPAPSIATKSDKPTVELFVMSHCPYGTQMEKGMLPVANALGNKIDFEVKFVNYAMHPSKGEVEEQLNQYCIQQEFKSKYTTYLGKFLEAGNAADAFKAAGLTQSDISKCVAETDQKYSVLKNLNDRSSWLSGSFPKFLIHEAENQKYGVQGSPTLVINGQQVQSGRDANSLLAAVCAGFTNKPAECNTDLSSFGNPAPGFGFGTQGGTAAAAGCGA